MKLGTAAIAALGVWVGSAFGAGEPARPVDELLRGLGAEDFPDRERATADLWARGMEVRELLEEAAGSDEVEVALRARSLLRKIELGILPDSPPEVVELVLQYDRSKPNEREGVVRKLVRLKAWRQVLKLYELETEPDSLEMLDRVLDGVPVWAAREALAAGPPDVDAARELLRMGRTGPHEWVALAELERCLGRLEEARREAAADDGRGGHLRRWAIEASAGNLEAAAVEIDAAGEPLVAAGLRALDGDPVPLLERLPVPPLEVVPEEILDYRRAVVGRWQGREVPGEVVDRLVAGVKGSLDDDSWHRMGMLFALGQAEQGEPLFGRLSMALAFHYHEKVEEVDEALAVVGLDPGRPDYRGWCAERFQVLLERADEREFELLELSMMGAFLEGRGLLEELDEAFAGPLTELGEKDPESFIEVIEALYSGMSDSGVVRPVLKAAARFAEGNDQRRTAVRLALFREQEFVHGLWERIRAVDPAIATRDLLEVTARLLDQLPDRDGQGARWWDRLVERAGEEGGREKSALLNLLLDLALATRDADRFLIIHDLLMAHAGEVDRKDEAERIENFRHVCLMATGQWEPVLEWVRGAARRRPSSAYHHARLAACLRRAGGDAAEIERHEQQAELLTLGDVRMAEAISSIYQAFGDFDRARHWLGKAMRFSTDWEAGSFAVFYYEAKEAGDWKTAASLGEVELLSRIMMGRYNESPDLLLQLRIEIEMARGLAEWGTDAAAAERRMEESFRLRPTDPSLADYFFPALRKAGLDELHDRWFARTWAILDEVTRRFPDGANSKNTAAWTASRANRRLDEAERMLARALELSPGTPAYLDTMAEIHFARGDRGTALEWSMKAVGQSPGMLTITRQYERFRVGEFPDR